MHRGGRLRRGRGSVRHIAGAALFSAAVIGLPQATLAQELIVNGGFEQGPRGVVAPGWLLIGTIGVDDFPGRAQSGSQYLSMLGGTASQTINVARAGNYTFSYWLRGISGSFGSFTATIGGTQVQQITAALFPYTQYSFTIALAAGNQHVLFQASAFPNAWSLDNVSLMLLSASLSPLLPSNAPSNVKNTANAIDRFVAGGGTIPAGFQNLFNLNGQQLQNALTQLSGETGASSAQQSASANINQFFNTIFDQFGGVPMGGGATQYADESFAYAPKKKRSAAESEAYAAVTPTDTRRWGSAASRWSAWSAGYGGRSQIDGDASVGTHTTTAQTWGVVAGADYRGASDTTLGFALSGGGSNFDVANGLGGGDANVMQAALYGRQGWGAAYLAGALAFGRQDVTTTRNVMVAGLDTLRGQFVTNTVAGRAEAGYRFGFGSFGATPYAAAQVTNFDLPAYTETSAGGANTFALAYASRDVTALRSEVGARFDYGVAITGGDLILSGRAAWAHDYNDDRVVTATFQTLPGASFVVAGAQPAADALLASAGAEIRWMNGFSLAGKFEGEFSSTTESYAGKGSLKYVW